MALIAGEPGYMGQDLLNPPSVEGWHTGQEWIDSGSLVRWVNFVANRLGDPSLPGVKEIIGRVGDQVQLTAEELVDRCLDILGPVRVEEGTRQELEEHAKTFGPIHRGSTEEEKVAFAARVCEILQLIASTREYQFG